MNLLAKLNSVSHSTDSLASFLKDSIDDVFNFVINNNQSNLISQKQEIEKLLLHSYGTIRNLDFSISENRMYVDILLQLTERLNISFYFLRLIRIKSQNNLELNKKNYATSLYINGLRSFDQYNNRIDDILKSLELAFKEEEDNDIGVLTVFFNFYIHVVDTFLAYNQSEVISFISRIRKIKSQYLFLSNPIVEEVLQISVAKISYDFYQYVHQRIDRYFERNDVKKVFNKQLFLIEDKGLYVDSLSTIDENIYKIREIASSLYNGLNEVFYSLGRGVSILTEQQQLYAYMYSFGPMHFAKCNYAFGLLNNNFFINDIEILDWGCGQALASMTYLNFIQKNNINQNIIKIHLNEPSEIAIKRGSLHIRKFNKTIELETLNKDLNSINKTDFEGFNPLKVKLHLFSNILDIDGYSTRKLVSLIKGSFKGLNYFIIVSPYITDLKTNRIDSFISEFELINGFSVLEQENWRKGDWSVYDCSMVLRIFKVNL